MYFFRKEAPALNHDNTYGLAVCGGKSSRMGRDKAFINYHGLPQSLVVYRMLEDFCGKTFVSCSDMQASEINTASNILIDDKRYADSGPAAALLTAINNFPGKNFLMVGCDYPLLNEHELRKFISFINDETFAAAFFNQDAEKYEPLIAYYSADAAQIFSDGYPDASISLQHFLQDHAAAKYYPANTRVIKSIDTPEQALQVMHQLDKASIQKVNTTKFISGEQFYQEDMLVVEEPLEIRMQYKESGADIQKTISITMRTPGNDTFLAAGFLFTEGIIKDMPQIKMIIPSADGNNLVLVIVNDHIQPDMLSIQRNFYATSSCGVCGKASIDSIRAVSVFHDLQNDLAVERSIIYSLPEKLKKQQVLFESTGGLHASALFTTTGQLVYLAEDVGRHNSIDKLIGFFFNEGRLPLNDYILFLSGRISFELVQKAYMAGIKIIVAAGAPSSLAVELAISADITLIGFLRDNKYNVYTGIERIK